MIESGFISDTTPQQVTAKMVGSSLANSFDYEKRPLGDTVLKIDNLSSKAFDDVSLDVKKGEIVAFTGLQGSGASEVLQCIFGEIPPSEGCIYVKGLKAGKNSIHNSMKHGVGFLPSNRKENSVLPDMSIIENMYVSEHSLSSNKFHIFPQQEKTRYDVMKQNLGIKANDEKDLVVSLSGGNQQKIFFARWLNTDADILLFDNPTQGIDVGAKAEIYKLILHLASKGKTIIFNSLEIPEVMRLADRCVVFYSENCCNSQS